MAIIVRDLVAVHSHNIGHRRLVKGEAWCRMQFRDQKDLDALAGTLRWSAFRFEEPAQPPAVAPVTAEPAKSKR
jgi:hypothetical protein